MPRTFDLYQRLSSSIIPPLVDITIDEQAWHRGNDLKCQRALSLKVRNISDRDLDELPLWISHVIKSRRNPYRGSLGLVGVALSFAR